jgi:hypothetical protein
VAHDTIEMCLRMLRSSGRLPPLDEVLESTRQAMRDTYRSSRDHLYRDSPKTTGLFEHEYDVPVDNDDWRDKAELVDLCLRNFYSGPTLARIRELPLSDWLELEELTGFMLDGVKVHVKLDFSHRTDSGVALIDWKTGRSKNQDHRLQFGCYSLYACRNWDLEPSQVCGLEVNLATGTTVEHRFQQDELKQVEDHIRGSLDHMRELLRDPEQNEALEEDFPKVEGQRTCSRCVYLKVCDSSWCR